MSVTRKTVDLKYRPLTNTSGNARATPDFSIFMYDNIERQLINRGKIVELEYDPIRTVRESNVT